VFRRDKGILVHETFASRSADLVLAQVDAYARKLDERRLEGVQRPLLSLHPTLEVGLAAASGFSTTELEWIDVDGTLRSSLSLAVELYGYSLAPTSSGFLIVGSEYNAEPNELRFAELRPEGGSPVWQSIPEAGPWSVAHATGRDGMVSSVLATHWFEPKAVLFAVEGGTLREVGRPSNLPTSSALGVEAIFEHDGRLFFVYGGHLPDGDWAMWLVDAQSGEDWRLDRSPLGPEAAILTFGDELLIASRTIQRDARVSVSRFEPGSVEPLPGPLIVLAEAENISRSPSMARTQRGFMITWWEGRSIGASIRVRSFDCCEDDSD
jgi:hypothetical protein